jgi:integrase
MTGVDASRGTLDELHAALAARHRFLGHTESTIALDRAVLGLLGKHPDDCTMADYEAVIMRSKSQGTRAVYARRLRCLVAALVELGLAQSDTHTRIPVLREPKRQPRPLSQEQVDKLFKEAPQPWNTMFRIAYLTGARASELWAMQGQDLTHGRYGPELLIHGKGRKDWTVPCHPKAAELIESFGTLGRLWDIKSSAQLSSSGSRAMQRILGPHVSLHCLRHTFATRLMEATGNVVTVQRLLRHENLSSTMVYVEVASSAQRDAVLALSA